MRKVMLRCVTVLCCGVIFASGCAKEELVKKDEPVAAPVAPPPAPKPAEPTTPREEVIAPQTVKEAPISTTEDTSQATAPVSALEKIYFDFDAFTLSQTSRDTLAKNAEILLKKLSGNIQIEGHCDERGSDEYNLALGEKRAKSALNYLVTLGVPAERLSVISYGKEKPADPGHDEAAWAKNRRGEFVIIK